MDENGDTGGDHEVTPEVDALGAETPVPLDVADHNSSTENAAFTAAKIIAMPPWTPSLPRTPYGEDRRHELEQLLFRLLHDEDRKPFCWNALIRVFSLC